MSNDKNIMIGSLVRYVDARDRQDIRAGYGMVISCEVAPSIIEVLFDENVFLCHIDDLELVANVPTSSLTSEEEKELEAINAAVERATKEARKKAFTASPDGTLLSVVDGALVSVNDREEVVRWHKKL